MPKMLRDNYPNVYEYGYFCGYHIADYNITLQQFFTSDEFASVNPSERSEFLTGFNAGIVAYLNDHNL